MGTLASGSIDLKSLKVAGSQATGYITNINNNGIQVSSALDNKNQVTIDSTGMRIYRSINSTKTKIAEFSSYINIGVGHTNTNDGSAAIGVGLTTAKTNQIVVGRYNESNSNATFIIGDGINSSNKSNLLTVGNIQGKQMTDTFVGDGDTKTFTLTNEPSQQPTISTSSGSYTITNWSGTTITLNSNLAADVVLTVTYPMLSNGGYLVIGDNDEVHGENALVCMQQASNAIVRASGVSSSVHGVNQGGEMSTSGPGSSIYGYIRNSGVIIAKSNCSSIHGYVYDGTMTTTSVSSSIYGWAEAGSTMTASGRGASIHGDAYDNGTMTTSGEGASIYGYVQNNATMTASGIASSIHGNIFNATVRASGDGSSIYGTIGGNSIITAFGAATSIHGFALSESTMTASGVGASIHGFADYYSTMTASGPGSSIHGYVYDGTITASGQGALIHGYTTNNSTMTASGNGSVALGESTHALKNAQLAIGTFNEDDTISTTIHPSGTNAYGKYAFIIGNGTGESSRSNALTVDWDGNVDIASGAKYKVGGTALQNAVTLVTGGNSTAASIGANTYGTVTTTATIPSGYIVVGVARITSNHPSALRMTGFDLDLDGKIVVYYHNASTSNFTDVKVTTQVACIKQVL